MDRRRDKLNGPHGRGGAVFGGPIGFAAATANVLLEQASGDDLLGHAVALLSDDAKPSGTDLADPNLLAARPPEKVATLGTTQAFTPLEASGFGDIVWRGPRFGASQAESKIVEKLQEINIESKAIPDATTDADTTTTLLPEAATAVSQPKSLKWLPGTSPIAKSLTTGRSAR